ncbi:MAG TPA: hypothetical protein PLM24_09890 [Methanothrix sp.]|nr:hypothetical protein [Methanothrix sp.]HPR67431.1 hypothetical protein [Methanothrix sp.]
MKKSMRACTLAALILTLCLGGASGQFGYRVTNSSPEDGKIVEDFASAGTMKQTPVQMGYWDVGPNVNLFDQNDVIYLHIGDALVTGVTSIRPNDIRLTPAAFGPYPAGSKVVPGDVDLSQKLTAFPPGLPRIVFVDEGTIFGQFDLSDPVYIKTVKPLGEIGTGDVRLNSTVDLPGTRVLDFDPDNGATCSALHPGPSFNMWLPGARGVIRFINANGNLYTNPGALMGTWPSPPIYDEPDVVYFDVSSPTAYPRNFGYLTPNAIRISN